ncbi:MAG: hypothetical protein M1380_11140 [Chloroflexi bacterium]|nr:hypothetical protein [Chloroflexota bacterium]
MVVGKLRKVGNSLVVAVPKEEAEALDLHEGDLVTMDIQKAEVRPCFVPTSGSWLSKAGSGTRPPIAAFGNTNPWPRHAT